MDRSSEKKATRKLARTRSEEEAQTRKEQAQIRKWFPMLMDPTGKVGTALTYHQLDQHLTATAGHPMTELDVKAHWDQAELYNGQDQGHEEEHKECPSPEESIDGDEAEEGDLLDSTES